MNAPQEIYAPDRTTYIGGSDVASILGVSPWKSAFALYLEKTGASVEEETPADKAKIFRRGKRWEPIVVEMLVDELRERGHEVELVAQNQRYADPTFPFLAAEIDLELLIDGEPTNGEAKTVIPFAAKFWGEEETDEIPIYYAAQVMHGLMIQPRRRAVVAALTGFDDRPRVHWVERDEETIAGIRERELEFWRRVQDREPPDPETADDVKWLYARDGGEVIEADNKLAEMIAELRHMKGAIKGHEARAEVLATQIKAHIGKAATVIYQGQWMATFKSNKDSQKTDWKAAYLDLSPAAEHIKKFTTTTVGNRPLLIK